MCLFPDNFIRNFSVVINAEPDYAVEMGIM